MMMLPDSEPDIVVGIVTADDPRLSPRGYSLTQTSDGSNIFAPSSSDSTMRLSRVVFGKGFHWQTLAEREYRGCFRQLPCATPDGFTILNTLPLEEYVASVVASEMHPQAPDEFIVAHAVMSRTWALRKILGFGAKSEGRIAQGSTHITWEESDVHTRFHVCSDDHCQRYQGISEREAYIRRLLLPSRGVVLVDPADNSPADARFSKCCGGRTERFSTCWADEDYSYLQSISDPYCDPRRIRESAHPDLLDSILKYYDRSTDYFRWSAYVIRDQIKGNLRVNHSIDIGEILNIKPLQRGDSGRISRLLVEGSKGSAVIGK